MKFVAPVVATISMASAEMYPVSVCKDATYFLDTEAVCGGSADGEPTGTACPVTGDSSTDPTCLPGNPSYDANSTKCVAPVDAKCAKLASGSWGCYWPPIGCPGGVVDPDMPTNEPTDEPTSEPTDKPQGQYPVSVCKDATYFLDTEAVCAGSADGEPTGTACPVTGDYSTDPTCLPGNPSYDANSTKCVAPVDAKCAKLASGSWGCYWPPVGCPGGVEDM